MDTYTLEQRIKIIQTYYECSRSLKRIFRKICDVFGVNSRPNESTIKD